MSAIIAISADAIVSVDSAQRIIVFNEGAEKMFGYAAGEVMGQPLTMLLPERARAIHADHIEEFGR
ncbi:MAG: PAS domain S-box protein, partial [Gemmatimonadaceae bacterium]